MLLFFPLIHLIVIPDDLVVLCVFTTPVCYTSGHAAALYLNNVVKHSRDIIKYATGKVLIVDKYCTLLNILNILHLLITIF